MGRDLPRRPLIVAAAGLVSAHCLWFRDHRVDDAFITMRYARHLAEGIGPVFNAGERVEGYTNFLWMALLAGAHALGLPQPIVAVGLGATCVVLVVAFVATAPWQGLGRDVGPAAGLMLACCGSFVYWGTSGLETGLFSALLLVSLWLFGIGEARRSTRLDALLAVTLALATLTRPEGVLVWLLLVIARALERRGRLRPEDLGLVLPYLAIVGAHVAWRWAYYGQLLPNSYHAKVGHRIDEVAMGWRYLAECLTAYGILFLAALGALGRRGVSRRALALLGGIVVVFTAYIVGVGGDNFPLLRFFAPVMPALCLLAAAGIQRLPSRLLRAVALAVACVLIVLPSLGGRQFQRASHDTWDVQVWSELGQWLDEHLVDGESVALNPVGAVGYHCRHRVVDMLGINDATIARSEPCLGPPGHNRADAAHVLRLQPTVVLIGVNHPMAQNEDAPSLRPVYESDRQILALDALHERYEPTILGTEHHRFSAMVRPDAALQGAIER